MLKFSPFNFFLSNVMFMEFLILRFVNTIKLSNLTIDDIWKIARKIKSEVSLDKLCPKRTIYYKQEPYPVLSVFEQHLGIKPLEVIYKNITTKFLENAAQMFIYLKGCPAEDDKETKQHRYTELDTIGKFSILN